MEAEKQNDVTETKDSKDVKEVKEVKTEVKESTKEVVKEVKVITVKEVHTNKHIKHHHHSAKKETIHVRIKRLKHATIFTKHFPLGRNL